MAEYNKELVQKFVEMAASVNALVTEVSGTEDILNYMVATCEKKAPCELLIEEPGTPTGPLGPNKCPTRVNRVIAAPQLSEEDFAALKGLCEPKGIICIREDLRKYAAGIDMGLNNAVCGVAASGTCMLDTDAEDIRLASMISEISVIVLKKSDIYAALPDIAQIMRERMGQGPAGSFTSLVTGPSRTADIECVSAVGVHGPLELHILLLEA